MSYSHRKKHRRWAAKPIGPTLTDEELNFITKAARRRSPGDVIYRWVKRRRRWTKRDDKRYQRVVWRDPRPKPEPRVVALDRVAIPTLQFLMRSR